MSAFWNKRLVSSNNGVELCRKHQGNGQRALFKVSVDKIDNIHYDLVINMMLVAWVGWAESEASVGSFLDLCNEKEQNYDRSSNELMKGIETQ